MADGRPRTARGTLGCEPIHEYGLRSLVAACSGNGVWSISRPGGNLPDALPWRPNTVRSLRRWHHADGRGPRYSGFLRPPSGWRQRHSLQLCYGENRSPNAMTNRSKSNLIIYGFSAAMCLLALGNTGHLSWREDVRLLLILVGLVVLYIRYRPTHLGASERSEADDSSALSYGAAVVVALSLMFVVTQYDPATSSIALRSSQARSNWFFWASTLLVASMGSCFALSRLSELRLSNLHLVDRILTGVVLGVVAISLGSKKLIGPGVTGQDVLANLKILSYLLIWYPVTRAFMDPICSPVVPVDRASFLKRLDRWSGFLIVLFALFLATLTGGAYRAGRVLYEYRQAQALLSTEDFEAAETRFESVQEQNRALDFGPIRDRVLGDLAILYLRQGKQTEAGRAIGALRSATYDEATAHLKVARVYTSATEWASAARAYEAYLEKAGKSTGVLDELGGVYLQLRDSRGLLKLIERFKYVPEVETGTFEERIFIGNVHFYRNDYLDAQRFYEEAATDRPGDSYAVYKVGRALLARDRYQDAADRFRKAIELEPDFADAHYRLGVCYEEQGNKDEALRLYENTVELLPNHLDGLLAVRKLRK
jgi:tetratricopeptide (TPR) repeat protein